MPNLSQTNAAPDISSDNLRKLKQAYRHPFEYINPRLYQKKDISSPSPEDTNNTACVGKDEEERNKTIDFISQDQVAESD
jgi:hypothetical protein